MKKSPTQIITSLYMGILLVIFAGIVLHAPLTVALSSTWPLADFVFKSWKEILLGVALILALVLLWRLKRWDILRSRLLLVIGLYALLHLLLIPLSQTGVLAVIAGLLIDLRYLLFFVLVYVGLRLFPEYRRLFLTVFISGALLVGIFAILQVTVLPKDFLTVLGYGPQTIVPYLTVDENHDFIRISSTLRGPNPLGAYAVIVLAVAASFWLRYKQVLTRQTAWVGSVLVTGALVALWASYSRSALVAAIVALGIVFMLTVGRKLSKWLWVSLCVAALAFAGGLYAARDTYLVSNIILHENETTGAETSSNDGHIESLEDGTSRMLQQPLGGGIGSTGSASLYSGNPLIIENQYLFVAHEVGWVGLGLFLGIFGVILWRLWQGRRDWLALGVLASGVGLALIGLLLPVWVDDTVAIIWWGLAAVALAYSLKGEKS